MSRRRGVAYGAGTVLIAIAIAIGVGGMLVNAATTHRPGMAGLE